ARRARRSHPSKRFPHAEILEHHKLADERPRDDRALFFAYAPELLPAVHVTLASTHCASQIRQSTHVRRTPGSLPSAGTDVRPSQPFGCGHEKRSEGRQG